MPNSMRSSMMSLGAGSSDARNRGSSSGRVSRVASRVASASARLAAARTMRNRVDESSVSSSEAQASAGLRRSSRLKQQSGNANGPVVRDSHSSCVVTKKVKKRALNKDEMAAKLQSLAGAMSEHLTCPICLGIFDHTIALQPCMHKFCTDCFSRWSSISKECPGCRAVFFSTGQDCLVDRMCESFLKEFPEYAK